MRSSAAPRLRAALQLRSPKLQKIAWLKLVYLIWVSSINSLFLYRTTEISVMSTSSSIRASTIALASVGAIATGIIGMS